LVGYAYKQISCDSETGNRIGCFESQVFGVGPQIGYIIPLGHLQGYVNLKVTRSLKRSIGRRVGTCGSHS
jgi:hypothetical protein